MSDVGWQRVKQVFAEAIERGPGERPAFLDHACGGDAALRHEVESLIAAHGEAANFLDTPAGAPATAGVPWLGRRIGAYRIVGELGRGGMGMVFRAVRDDDAFSKQVALKLVRGGLDSEQLVRRFHRERQILARLQHPNIASVVDGGTTDDGQPYLIMEYVEGQPIDRYCASRSLAIRGRLEMFRQVCGAVHYAHQSLVVHRDLKPQNVLVTREGTPKLLDFGIAKLLAPDMEPDAAPTATMLPMMTPEYASPEQVKGSLVTTASDVYSLGVVLYELLTGQRPYVVKADSLEELVRTVCDTEPVAPSALVASTVGAGTRPPGTAFELKGDLDTIVMKALRKDPLRRYSSVQELSEDIRRHLEGLPVLARPDTIRYRTGKFLGRHRAGVVATALVFSSLVAAVVVTTREARVAERRSQETRRLANALVWEVHDAIQNIPGSTAARVLIVKRGLDFLDGLAKDSQGDKALLLELSKAYVRFGDAQGQPGIPNLGDSRGALASYGKALAIRQALASEDPRDPHVRQLIGTLHKRIGAVLCTHGDVTGSIAHLREAVRVGKETSVALGGDSVSRNHVLAATSELSFALLSKGDAADALAEARNARGLAEEELRASPDSAGLRYNYASTLEREGDALAALGDGEGALSRFLEFLETNQGLAADPKNGEARYAAASAQGKIAKLLMASGKTKEANERLAPAVVEAEGLAAADPQDVEARGELAELRSTYGDLLVREHPQSAEEQYEKAILALRPVVSLDASNLKVLCQLGVALLRQSGLQASQGRAEAAARSLAEATTISQELMRKDPAIREHPLFLARVRLRQAAAAPGSSCEYLNDSLQAWNDVARKGPLTTAESSERSASEAAAQGCPTSGAASHPVTGPSPARGL